ncbi:MAG: hypothetical protein IK104_11040 [Clostridia bacterium]|nr:hypothetical protein [Clostridia bacterium]
MAAYVKTLHEDFDSALARIETGIMSGSLSATLESKSDFHDGYSRCSVRVFERYSWLGSNRVSLSVTLFQGQSGEVKLCAVASGGSQAMFYKINTFGEERFLDTLRRLF